MRTPKELKAHAPDYKPGAWQQYTLAELGQWIHLLATRAGHRAEPAKRAKDLADARNYWRMMGAFLDELGRGP